MFLNSVGVNKEIWFLEFMRLNTNVYKTFSYEVQVV